MKKAQLFSIDSGVTVNSQSSAEDDLRLVMTRKHSHLEEDSLLYRESARRYLTQKCITECGLNQSDVPFFGNDYFNHPSRFRCVSDCFEAKMSLHFGNLAKEKGLAQSYDVLRDNWQRQLLLNPNNDYNMNYHDTLNKWEKAKEVLRKETAKREQKYHSLT